MPRALNPWDQMAAGFIPHEGSEMVAARKRDNTICLYKYDKMKEKKK